MSAATGASGAPSGPATTSGRGRRRVLEKPLAFRLLFENFGLKVLSLLFALGLYASMHSTSTAQRTLQVPLIADMPAPGGGRTLMTELPETLSVTVEGPRQVLDDLQARLDPLPLNLRSARDERLAFSPEMVAGLPRNARVTRIIPESLEIRWEDVLERVIEVQVPVAGQIAKDLELREVSVAPKTIKALGPESLVKGIQLARAEPFEIGGLPEGRHTRSLALAPPPAKVVFDHRTVEATIDVARKRITRDFHLKVQVVGLLRGRAEPAFVHVTIAGTPDRVTSLRPENVLVRVDPKASGVDGLKPGSALMPVIVDVLDATATSEPASVVVHW